MAVRTWVGRFCVADGRVEEEGPWLGSLIRQRPDDDADELYVLIEPATPNSEEFTSQLVDVIAQLYQHDPLSLTGALTRSLRAAHEHLRDWNRKSLAEHRVGAGASCLALRGSEAYVAQVGPSLAYVRTASGEVRRIEAHDRDIEHALGLADEIDLRLTRLALEPGDLVLVASSQLDAIAPEQHVERVLSRPADDVLPEFYLLCRDMPNFALVLLSCFEEEAEAPPEFLTRAGDDAVSAAALSGDGALDSGGADAMSATVTDAPVAVGPPAAQATLAVGEADWLPPRPPIKEQVREITASTAPAGSTGIRLRGESAKPSYKRTTGIVPLPQFRVPKLAIFAAFALVILGVLAYAYIPGSLTEDRESSFNTLVADAREANARAQATGDAGLKRQLLVDARGKLTDAAKIHGDNADVVSLQSDVTAALGSLDAIYEIKDATPVADLAQLVTGSLSATMAVVGGDHAYVLDAKGARVLRVALDGSTPPETILSAGALAGFVNAGKPMQIGWSEQSQSLIVVDDQRQAFAYFPDRGTLPLTVRGADGIGSFNAIATSGGNLYVLDVKENQIWRYLPGQGGFDSERTALLDQADLKDATELAVGQDVFVLDAKQGIRRFVGKAESAFPIAGIDTPMVSPGSMSVLPGSNRIVVADRGNKRIIVASPSGAFLRQLVSPAFTDLRSVSVDEGKGLLYVLNGDTLLRASFPP
jgi:serine/threonine protein phosphatase PrpC